jgi:hypothetical protein
MADCNLPLPCNQAAPSDVSTRSVLRVTCTDPGGTGIFPSAIEGNGSPDGEGVVGNASARGGTGVRGTMLSPGPQPAFGTGVSGVATRGNGGQFTSSRGVGVFAAGGLGSGGDPSVEGMGVVGAGDVVGVLGESSGTAVKGTSLNGTAASFQNEIRSPFTTNDNPALDVGTTGTGDAASLHIDNPRNRAVALNATTSGPGAAGLFRMLGQGVALAAFSEVFESILAISKGGTAVFASTEDPDERAGVFSGDVDVFGTLTATAKNFLIDHPLEPANKYLAHASVESSEQTNVYSGNVVLDDDGEAVVTLPLWVEALNEDFRYQLTCVGGFAPVYVADEVADSQFRIRGGEAGMKVSWQLTGIRKDAWAKANPMMVEQDKPEEEKGHFRHPELFGSDEQHSVTHVRFPRAAELLEQSRDR